MPKYTAEQMFKDYLVRVNLGHLSPDSVQYIETRRGFYAGMASLLVAIRETDSESDLNVQMDSVNDDVTAFWQNGGK